MQYSIAHILLLHLVPFRNRIFRLLLNKLFTFILLNDLSIPDKSETFSKVIKSRHCVIYVVVMLYFVVIDLLSCRPDGPKIKCRWIFYQSWFTSISKPISRKRSDAALVIKTYRYFQGFLPFWYGFPFEQFTKQQNFGLVQIESICIQQIKGRPHDKTSPWEGKSHCGKRRKFCLQAFLSFSYNDFKTLLLQDC